MRTVLLYVTKKMELISLANYIVNFVQPKKIIYFSEEPLISEEFINNVKIEYISRYPLLDNNIKNIKTFSHFNSDNHSYLKHKYNLMAVLTRFTRKLNISSDFNSIDSYSNKLIRYTHKFLIINDIDLFIISTVPHHPFIYSLFMLHDLLKLPHFYLNDYPHYHFFSNSNITIPSYSLDSRELFTNTDEYYSSSDVILNSSFEEIYNYVISAEPSFGIGTHDENEELPVIFSGISRLKHYKFSDIVKKLYYRFIDVYFHIKDFVFRKSISKLPLKKVGFLIDKKFVFFALHFQPEATTTPLGNHFRDQIEVIQSILSAIDEDFYLVIKEHPYFWKKKPLYLGSHESMVKVRNKEFYNELLNNPKIILLRSDINSREIVKMAIGVVTITGTIALESMIFRKPALVFGDYVYKFQPNAFDANDPSLYKKFFESLLVNNDYEDYELKVKKYLSIIQSNSFTYSRDDSDEFYSGISIFRHFFD